MPKKPGRKGTTAVVYDIRHGHADLEAGEQSWNELQKELDDFGVPTYRRVQIPLRGENWRVDMRRTADCLRGLANSLDLLARRNDVRDRTLLVEAGMEIFQANSKINIPTTSGRSG